MASKTKKTPSYIPKYVGKIYDEVARDLRADKIPFRVVKEDNEYYVITHDLRLDRFNFELENGIIVGESMG